MFFGSAILEVIIGLTFVYFLFSMIASALNEWIAGILKLRAKTLREGIQNLLDDPHARGLARDFFEHPLVRGLHRQEKESFPSYIPARTFARVLIDIVAPADLRDGQRDWVATYEKILEKLDDLDGEDGLGRTLRLLIGEAGIDVRKIRDIHQTVENLQSTRQQLLDHVNLAGVEFAEMESVTQALDKIKDVETTIRQTETEALATLNQAQLNVETYFNESMERVSGWYKRQVQIILVVIASVLVLAFNVDSIAIADNLITDPAVRSSVVALAEGYSNDVSENSAESVRNLMDVVDQTGLPIGWQTGPNNSVKWPATAGDWFYKVVGLLITIIAVAQGAPFWFEMTNKLVNIRLAGKKPKEDNAPS